MTRVFTSAAILLVILFCTKDPDADTRKDKPELISQDFRYDGQPALAVDAHGIPWVAWVAYEEEEGDHILCAHREEKGWSKPVELVGPGNYVRPAIAAMGDRIVVAWTATTEVRTSIWASVLADGEWSKPARVTPEDGYHQNPEMCVDPSGRLWMTWQAFHDRDYDIFLASFDGTRWSAPIAVCDAPGNDWDPVVAADSKGALAIAWSAFREADYDVFVRRYAEGKLSDEVRLTDHEAYDMHPGLAVDAQDRVWGCWDRISVPKHDGSGNTTITGEATTGPQHGGRPDAWVEVRCLAGDRRLAPASDEVKIPEGYRVLHCGYPKIAVDAGGAVWLVHRALTNAAGAAGKKKQAGGKVYWWDVLAYRYEGGSWTTPEVLEHSDGYLEEASVCATRDAVWVAHEMEHRVTWGDEAKPDDHHAGWKPLGRNGDIYVTRLAPSTRGEAPKTIEAPALSATPSELSSRLVPREEARYETKIGDEPVKLLFGDLHKHSNVSRCSGGTEPSLDDHYRYSHDVCQYDFMMMSDHSQHTTDFNWWRIQKLADFYYLPGVFTTLFGYEASLKWPEGHRNIVFPARPAPIVRPGVDGANDREAIWKVLAGQKAITIPHTSADPRMGNDWAVNDPDVERLVEMFQACRGSYECAGCPRQHANATAEGGFVQDALAKGYRLGFICSSDHGYGVSYACVYAKGNSREEVFDALHEKRCYGSTSYGIVLDVRADGHFMGEEYAGGEAGAALTIHARGPAAIRSVEVISNAKVVQSWGSAEEPIGKREVDLTWQDAARKKTRYYYVRLILENDEMAWSSPIWVTRGE